MASASAPASPRPAGRSLAAAAVKVQDKVRRQGRTRQITINLKNAKNAAAIVREVAVGEMKWKEASTLEESCNANLYWYERAISVEEVKRLSDWQRVNMIPGMQEMAKKASLARALNRMRALFPDEYDFFPGTWTLPAQLDEFRKHCAAQSSRARPSTFIVKPSGGCQGAAPWSKCPPWQGPSSAPVPPQGAPGGSAAARYSQVEARPLGAQRLPQVLELAASKVADSTAFVHVGASSSSSSRGRYTYYGCSHYTYSGHTYSGYPYSANYAASQRLSTRHLDAHQRAVLAAVEGNDGSVADPWLCIPAEWKLIAYRAM